MTMQFLSRRQKPSENPVEYLDSLQQIAVQAFSKLHVDERDGLVRSRFAEGTAHNSLREHLLRMPPANTTELTKIALRFITADTMARLPEAPQYPVMAVEQTVESSHVNSPPRATDIAHTPSRAIYRGGSNWTWNKRPPYSNSHNSRTGCIYCRWFGRKAWRADITDLVTQVNRVFAIYLLVMLIMYARLWLEVECKVSSWKYY